MLKDKIAMVSGAIRGVGFEILRQVAKRGATVVMYSRSMARAENSASRIEGKTYPKRLYLTNAQGIVEFMGRMAERHKHIDIFASMTMTERKKAATENSVKRCSDPREVATIAASAVSEGFVFSTGNTIVVDGGKMML